jgi:hypothetical protein
MIRLSVEVMIEVRLFIKEVEMFGKKCWLISISSYPFYVSNGHQVLKSLHLELHAILLLLASLTFKQIVGLYQLVVIYANLQLFQCHSIQVLIYWQSDQQITQLK